MKESEFPEDRGHFQGYKVRTQFWENLARNNQPTLTIETTNLQNEDEIYFDTAYYQGNGKWKLGDPPTYYDSVKSYREITRAREIIKNFLATITTN